MSAPIARSVARGGPPEPAPNVYVNLGTNERRIPSLCTALAMLDRAFGGLLRSSVYESEAVGFAGDPFFNMTAAFTTARPPQEVVRHLRAIEVHCGRDRARPRYAPRSLDADLLLHGDTVLADDGLELPRPEILTQAHVLGPLAEVAGDRAHPVVRRTFGELWAAFGPARGAIRKVDVELGVAAPAPAGD